MNKKAIWAALAAMSLVAGLQSQTLFQEEYRGALSISLILLSGLFIYRLFSIMEKERDDYESKLLSERKKKEEEVHYFRVSMEDALEKNQKSRNKQHLEVVDVFQDSTDTLVEIEEKLIRSVREEREAQTECLKAYMTEAASLLQTTVSNQQSASMKIIKDSLEKMDERNRRFEEIASDSLKISEKLFLEGYEGIRTAIDSFSAKASDFSSNANDMLLDQNDLVSSFASDIQDELKNHTKNLSKAMKDALSDLSRNNSEMVEEIRVLGNEYRRFEELSGVMIDKMRMISEEDYSLMKDIFKDDIG